MIKISFAILASPAILKFKRTVHLTTKKKLFLKALSKVLNYLGDVLLRCPHLKGKGWGGGVRDCRSIQRAFYQHEKLRTRIKKAGRGVIIEKPKDLRTS